MAQASSPFLTEVWFGTVVSVMYLSVSAESPFESLLMKVSQKTAGRSSHSSW